MAQACNVELFFCKPVIPLVLIFPLTVVFQLLLTVLWVLLVFSEHVDFELGLCQVLFIVRDNSYQFRYSLIPLLRPALSIHYKRHHGTLLCYFANVCRLPLLLELSIIYAMSTITTLLCRQATLGH